MGSTYAVIAAPVTTVPYGDPLKLGQRILWTGHYEAFGRPDSLRPVCPGFFPNPIQYTGYYSDGDIFEHYYAKARYYDPYTGRFLSRDPADFDPESFPGAVNRYTYAANNPLRYVDPDGEFFFTALFGLAFEAFVYDVTMFALAGGVSEIINVDDATLGDFFKGALLGGLSGVVSSLTGGLVSNMIGDSLTSLAFTDFVTVTNASSSLTNAFLVSYYPSDYYNKNLLPWPRAIHHGASGWGSLGQLAGLGLWTLQWGPVAGWLGQVLITAGGFSNIDDFMQHVCIQPFDEGAHFLFNTLYRYIISGEWKPHE